MRPPLLKMGPFSLHSSKDALLRTCYDCAVGWYTPMPGMVQCIGCSRGRYANQTGLSACHTCPAGRFSGHLTGFNVGSKESIWGAENTIWSWTTLFVIYLSFFIIFVLLLSGSQGTPWQSACEACSPGKYMLSTQSSECLSCDRGKFRTSDLRLYSMWTSDPFEMWRFRCFLVKGIQSQPKATSPRRLHATRALLVNSAGRMRGHVKNVRLAKKRRLGWEGVLRRKMGKSRVEHPAHLVLVGVKGPLPVWIFFWG